MSFIRAENLVKHYGTGDGLVKAVKGISFEIEEGEFVQSKDGAAFNAISSI